MDPATLAAIAAIGSSAISSGGSLLGGFLSYGTSKKLMARQFEYQKALSKYVTSNHHQWNTSSLKAAGLNPVLSASGGSSGGTGGSVSLPSAPNFDLGYGLGNISSAINMKHSLENHEIDIANKEAQLLKTASDIGLVQSQIDNINSSTKANEIDNVYRTSPGYANLRWRQDERKAYGDGFLRKEFFNPYSHIFDEFYREYNEKNSLNNSSAIKVKKSSPWTNYKFKYFKR